MPKTAARSAAPEKQETNSAPALPMSYDVRINSLRMDGSTKGTASVNLNGQFAVRGISVMKGKGYLEPALYLSQRHEFDRKIKALRRTKERLMDDDLGGCALPVEDLMIALEAGAPEVEGFAEIVERVTVMAEDKVRFRLRCGLELTESIERAVR